MRRKEGSQPRQVGTAQNRRKRAYKRIKSAIEVLSTELPEPASAQTLVQLCSEIVDALCSYLEQPQDFAGSLPGEPPWHPVVASRLADVAIQITSATLTYARHHPDELSGILPELSKWPAIISLDPTRDIRKVDRNPGGAAARFYAPILDRIGRAALFPTPNTREQGLFHRIATAAAESVKSLPGWPEPYRLRGLPWWLDYVDPQQIYVFRPNNDRHGGDREWAIALKYLLHLTLSPEPFRSQLRAEWRASRVGAFANFNPSGQDGVGKYCDLLATSAKPAPVRSVEVELEEFSLPALELCGSDDEHVSSKPIWAWWWEDNLKYEPDALFGHSKPLNEWSDVAVARLTNARTVRDNPRAAFGRCVDAIVDAFLHLRGIAGGLKAITNKPGKKLPLIRANKMPFGDELRQQTMDAARSLRRVGN